MRKDDEEPFASASETVQVRQQVRGTRQSIPTKIHSTSFLQSKFPPPPGSVKKYYKVVENPPKVNSNKKRSSVGSGNIHKNKDIFGAPAPAPEAFKPVFQVRHSPKQFLSVIFLCW